MAYSKTNWQNEPSHATPLSADNLNKIENELYNQSVNLVVDNSVSLGRKSATTVGTHSSTLGYNCTASGNEAHAEGSSTTAEGNNAHAEGNTTHATGNNAHAEGMSTTASALQSHAEGYGTTASGDYSHAEGMGTTASGSRSHAEGYSTTASGDCSHAQNRGTIANGDNQTALGTYNIADSSSLVIVGNGADSSNRSNALTVDGSGNVTIAGSLTDGNGNTPNEVEWTQHQLSGTKIATVSIDGTPTDVYAPTGGGGGGASSLSQLDDVSISTPTNNQVLKYNSTTQKWENGTGGGGGTSDYEDLTNKPQINGVALSGNKTTEDLNIFESFNLSFGAKVTPKNVFAIKFGNAVIIKAKIDVSNLSKTEAIATIPVGFRPNVKIQGICTYLPNIINPLVFAYTDGTIMQDISTALVMTDFEITLLYSVQ